VRVQWWLLLPCWYTSHACQFCDDYQLLLLFPNPFYRFRSCTDLILIFPFSFFPRYMQLNLLLGSPPSALVFFFGRIHVAPALSILLQVQSRLVSLPPCRSSPACHLCPFDPTFVPLCVSFSYGMFSAAFTCFVPRHHWCSAVYQAQLLCTCLARFKLFISLQIFVTSFFLVPSRLLSPCCHHVTLFSIFI
jgi:hypothetical protein